MGLKHLYAATLAAALLAGSTALACAQASPPPDPSKATTGKGNSAWTNPEIEAEPPTPNGGIQQRRPFRQRVADDKGHLEERRKRERRVEEKPRARDQRQAVATSWAAPRLRPAAAI